MNGTLRGQVTDDSGAVIPGAAVTITGPAAFQKTITTGGDGSYSVPGLPSGRYTVRVAMPGFSQYENTAVDIAPGKATALDIALRVALEKQEVTVTGSPGPQVSTEPDNNAGALVLRGEDLEALPDDPDDLAADLQALAGPSAGPNGGQIFIDGFSNGRLPPKESIREIRINQNPFSAEYDRLGFGRIEILTKPGSDKFHGQGFFNFSDGVWNGRNPYAPNKPSFQQRMYGGNISGPLSKRASFFLDLEKRDIDDNAVINATILSPDLTITPFSQAIVTPNRRTTISPRIDYQLSQNHTLVGRYSYSRIGQDNTGIGQFSLASRAYNARDVNHTLQLTETAVLGAKAVNETRVQYLRSRVQDLGDNSIPAINVLEAFTGGGAQIGVSSTLTNNWEIQNYTTVTQSSHTIRFGVRLRTSSLSDASPQNFGGTFTFGGGLAPLLGPDNQPLRDAAGQIETGPITSIERYRRTLLFQQIGMTSAQIRALGGGATQFSIAGGNPLADVSQTDVGVFAQDDWRLKPNFTLSMGLRYETQTNIHDWRDFAPRVGFAWAPGGRGNKQGKTVIRGGFGMFYDRFNENLVLQAIRYNGSNQQQYIVVNPDFYPNVPSISSLGAAAQPQAIRRIDQDLRAPYIMQTAIGIERQLPWNTTIATTFTNSHAIHLLRYRNINAPVANGLRPYGDQGNIYLYESSGILNQNQFITNVNSRVNRAISIFGFYVYNHANSNTDGAATAPSNQYDLSSEYGRSSLDIRHRFVIGGSIMAPMGIRFSPFISGHSGIPFNITTGRDVNGDTLFTERPAIATDLTKPGVVVTPWGAFDPNPAPGAPIIPRNFAEGPGYFAVNLRVSKTWGFGPVRSGYRGQSGGGGGGRGGDHGPRGGRGGGPGGMRMGGGFHGMFEGGSTEKKYNVTLSASARNLFNNVNPGLPIGNLTSPLFGLSNSLAGGFGPASAANNRRLELQLRFAF